MPKATPPLSPKASAAFRASVKKSKPDVFRLRVVAYTTGPEKGSPVAPTRSVVLELVNPLLPGREFVMQATLCDRPRVLELVAAAKASNVPVVYEPAGNMRYGWKWSDAAKCPGHGGTAEPCCKKAGEYNGFGSGGLTFTCPKSCSCHD